MCYTLLHSFNILLFILVVSMQCKVEKIFVPNFAVKLQVPLVLNLVSAGFPSPADDYIQSQLDLNKELVKHPFATFYVRTSGDSMIDAGIKENTTLVVDRAVETKSGDIIIARIGDEMLVKELLIDDGGKVWLIPRNDTFKPIEITPDTEFEIWGKVIYSITQH